MVYRVAYQVESPADDRRTLRWRCVARRLFCLVAVASGVACSGPGREDQLAADLLRRACEREFECSCDPELRQEDFYEGCSEVAENFMDVEPPRGAFDVECAQHRLGLLNTASCGDTLLTSRAEDCQLYVGSLVEGAPCGEQTVDDFIGDFDPLADRCGRGLRCIRGACLDIRTTPFGAEGFPCELGGRCDEGLSCREDTCVQLQRVGESCSDGRECIEGTRCADNPDAPENPTCVALARVGETCMGHNECASQNCPAGFCESPANPGAECGARLPCGPGLDCVEGTCQSQHACDGFVAPPF